MANIATNGTVLYQSFIEGNTVRVNSLVTDPAPAALLNNSDVIAVNGNTIGIVARTAADKGYCCTLNPKTPWKELGPTAQLQSIAWEGKFICGRIGRSIDGQPLIVQNLDASIISTTATGGTSEGILYYDEIDKKFIIADTKPHTCGKYILFKPVRRRKSTGEIFWTGQQVGTPDILFTTNGSTIGFKSGPQPKYPQFVIIGNSLIVNGGVTYNPPYPTVPTVPPVEPPDPPEPTMGLPTKVNDLWKVWNQRFPLPLGEENIRQNTIRFCEQVSYQFPNEGWGTKSSTVTNPISKDTVSQVVPANANNANKTKMTSWDLVLGAGTTNPTPVYSNHGEYDTTNQFYRPVNAVNHLGTSVPPNPEPPEPGDSEVLTELKKQTALLMQILEVLEQGR